MNAQAAEMSHQRTESMTRSAHDAEVHPLEDVIEYAKHYAREKPESAALICIGLGFVLGWKLKPW